MRRYQKKRLIELCNTIEEALEHAQYYCQRNRELLISLCADCQDGALSIGNAIEKAVGEGTQTLSLVEELCEQLYFITQEQDSLKQCIKRMKALLVKIIYSIKYDLPDAKLEILFLPYKASMWTALESIWQAAMGYENCNVTVMPVPYYKLYMAEEKGETAYEGKEFPDYVPVIPYEEYDIEKVHPDMIFIHNPYDDTNTLTRLPDQYHSSALKQYTDALVYSPYANFGAYDPVDHPFMCQTKALNYVDYVVVQSKKIAKLYSSAGVAKEKLITFGSPKADAIVNKLKERKNFPGEWERKLKDRTALLFNISLSYFIVWRNWEETKNNPEEYSFAMKVIERFLTEMGREKDYGVIWRPHPLMKDMLRSRGLERETAFILEMEQLIEDSQNMVIDYNADYIPAFQRSDGFITTYSSLISEYMITGKPIALYEWKYQFLENENQPVSYLNNYFLLDPDSEPAGKNLTTRKLFLPIVKTGEDPLKEGRLEDAKKGFGNLDGNAGEKIFSFLLDKLSF